jgi:hypothetical protein
MTRIMRATALHVFLGLFGLVGLLSFAACGTGGSGTDPLAGSASVTLAMTDAPSDAFEAVTVTVTSATLIGESGSASIPFPDGAPITVNLLELDGINTILGTATVPEGTYAKIRLEVADASVTWADGTVQPVTLVANGHVDLHFRHPITLKDGESTVIQLDFSAEDSLKLTSTGDGKLILRPQIFVSTTPQLEDGETPHVDDLAGVIARIDDEHRTLLLDVRHLLRVVVVVTNETMIVSNEGPLTFDDLEVRMHVRVEGTLDERGRLVASIIHVDPERLVKRGLITKLDLDTKTFVLLHRDQRTTRVAFDDATRVYFLRQALTTADLTDGQIAYVGGKIDPTDSTETLQAKVIRIRPDRFAGIVTDASGCETGTLAVKIGPRHLLARLEAAGITLSPENTIVLEHEPGFPCSGITEGLQVRVFGRLIPHVPDTTDLNPVRFHVVRRGILPHRDLVGTVVEVAPNPAHPDYGIFVLNADPILFFDDPELTPVPASDLGPVSLRPDHERPGRVVVIVTPLTTFHDGLTFSRDLVGKRVKVLGVFVGVRPRVDLIATDVLLANP